jgi:hypothetical protein
MPERSLLEIVRAAVHEVAPDELPAVDAVAREFAWLSDSGTPDRDGRRAVTSLALAVGVDLCRDPSVTGIPKARRRHLTELWSRLRGRPRPDLDGVPPAVREVDASRLEAAAVVAGREHGATDELAAAVGSALVRHWPRRP